MDNYCESCIFFIQHYSRYRNRYGKLATGHCFQGRRMKQVYDNHTCEFWQERQPEKKAK